MVLDDLKGDDWEVRATVHQNLVASRLVAEGVRRGDYGRSELTVCMEFLIRTIGDAAEMLEEDMVHHSGIGLIPLLGHSLDG